MIATIDIARAYRAKGIQTVMAMMPDEDPGNWKRPRGKWKHFELQWVTDAELDRWQYVWAEKPNMGMITGAISGGAFVLDLDVYKGDSVAIWWADLLARHHDGKRFETPTQRTGGGGTQMIFRAPPGWRPPTFRTDGGIDCRGEGGFAVLPPSLHDSGNHYRWLDALGTDDVEIQTAPAWLCEAIDAVNRAEKARVGVATPSTTPTGLNGHAPAHSQTYNPAPQTGTARLDGVLDDGREAYMTRLVWAAVVGAYREAPMISQSDVTELCEKVWSDYLAHTDSRLAGPPDTLPARLEQEGRGQSLFSQKMRTAFGQWDTKVAAAAALPDPRPDRPKPNGAIPHEPARKFADTPDADGVFQPIEDEAGVPPPTGTPALAFTPYSWIEPGKIPPRRFVYGRHYIRQFLSTDISPGGIGKSSLAIADAVAMAAHKDLLGTFPSERIKVAYWNGEDPLEELQRRVQAVCLHYGITPEEIEGRLFVDSGRLLPLILAHEGRNGVVLDQGVIDAIIASIRASGIDVLIIDPFIASHRVGENDNNAIELVAKAWSHIADVTNCAVNLVHHSRKLNGEEVTVESGRGASALLAACRSARTLNQMTKDEAAQLGVEQHRLYFRVDDGKSNLQPPAEGATWHRLVNVDLPNGPMGTVGDKVGVVTRWEKSDPMGTLTSRDLLKVQNAVAAGKWRGNLQARDWAGKAIAQALGFALPEEVSRVKFLLQTWLKSGALTVVPGLDASRRPRDFIEVGNWAHEE